MHGRIAAVKQTSVRYEERASQCWLWKESPCKWQGKVELQFTSVPLRQLEPAGSWTKPATVSKWLRHLNTGRHIPPPVVCATERGTLYIRDGNHRYEALLQFFGGNRDARVRVALVVPKRGYEFHYRWFATYGTYVLERAFSLHGQRRVTRTRTGPSERLGNTLVLVAHPDDEIGCAGLLQRLCDPVVLFATDGAPENNSFWQRYDSRQSYGRVRCREAAAVLALAGVHRIEFLSKSAQGSRLSDQQLHRAVPQLFEIVCEMVQRFKPDTLLVPAYEGGHPDHDVCSFIGWLIRQKLDVSVWEMPLYHRSAAGALVAQHFRVSNNTEISSPLHAFELQTRSLMMERYRSQPDLPTFISSAVEYYRPQADNDYSRPPHAGVLNYEAWQWPITGSDVCEQFRACTNTLGLSELNTTAPDLAGLTAACYSAAAGSVQV